MACDYAWLQSFLHILRCSLHTWSRAIRSKDSIISEIQKLDEQGFKEVILLGQNVNSYKDLDSGTDFPNLLRYCCGSCHPR